MRIGILGGTFDPIHNGHLIAAEYARQAQQLDCVLFIPAHRSPLKADTQATTAQRVAMTRLAIAENAAFALSMVDIARSPPSYAVDTVAILQQESPDADFVFLIGADQLAELPEWRAPEQLLRMVPLVALTRPGTDNPRALNSLPPAARARITLQKIPAVDVSASEIRRRVAAGESIAGLTPERVAAYIEKHGLYR